VNSEPQEIEVEVVESIDTVPTHTRSPHTEPPPRNATPSWNDTRQWRARVSTLDRRWWPLWSLLAVVVLLPLVLLAGLVVFAWVLLRLLGKLLAWLGAPSR
jgi:hypothetical protein